MGVTHEELIDRARQLAPAITARAPQVEASRQLHDDTIAELLDAELLSILVPRRWGGHEQSIHTHREVVEIISAGVRVDRVDRGVLQRSQLDGRQVPRAGPGGAVRRQRVRH